MFLCHLQCTYQCQQSTCIYGLTGFCSSIMIPSFFTAVMHWQLIPKIWNFSTVHYVF